MSNFSPITIGEPTLIHDLYGQLKKINNNNSVILLVQKRKCHSITAAVSLTQTHTIIMAHWQAHRQAHFSINVRRPGVESIAWSHFSSKAYVLRPPMRLWKMTWGRATVTCMNVSVSRKVCVQILLTGEADSSESAQNEARTNKRSSHGDI